MRAVNHAPFLIVPDDWRASQSLEHSNLNFLWIEPHQSIKPARKALDILSRQPHNQIGVNMHTGLAPQESQIILRFCIVLPAADQFGDVIVKRLNSDLELKRRGWELLDQIAQ